MTEKIFINGKEVWISVEAHIRQQPGYYAEEYFTASYQTVSPQENAASILFEEGKRPVEFRSPVQALEYAEEKLMIRV